MEEDKEKLNFPNAFVHNIHFDDLIYFITLSYLLAEASKRYAESEPALPYVVQ